MKRKSVSKHKRIKKANWSHAYVRYAVITTTVFSILLVSFLIKTGNRVHVLGTTATPVLLAEDQPTSTPNEDQHGEQQGSTPAPQPTGDQNTQHQQSSSDTSVDCVKPDGTHITTSFHDCQELNQKMGQDKFHFTSLSTPNEDQQQKPTAEPTQETAQGHLESQSEGNKTELNLESNGTHVEIKREDNGSIKITTHKADGTEVQLQTNVLDQINEALKEKDIEVSTSSANGFAITSVGVQAETNLPVTFDPSTKSLAVTTANGTKDLTTLPHQAVQNVLQQKLLTNVLSAGNQTTPNAIAGNNTVTLTELNQQPVYTIQGVLNRNLLGLFPMAYRRTVYVSAQDGAILQTQQAFFTQVLQALSF